MGASSEKKLNILLASTKVRAGGEAVHVYTLARELTMMGHCVYLLTSAEHGGMCAELLKGRIFVAPISDHNPAAQMRCIAVIRKIVKEHRFDIIHCHGRDSAFYVKCAGVRVPCVFTCHSLSLKTDVFHRALAGNAAMNIAVSGASKKFMMEGLHIPEEKIRVVPNGVDPSALLSLTEEEKAVLQQRFFIAPGSRVACIHGRFDPRKNHVVIGKALAALSPEKRKRLVILCSGSREVSFYNTLVGELRKLGVLSHFRFTGWTATREILGMSDLLLAPSTEESFLMTALEGFFMRVPVARSKTGGYEEMKDLCLGYEAMDVKAWSGILDELAGSDGPIYSDMTDRAYKHAMLHFTSGYMTEKILEVYLSVI
ncbi:MAG: glycosyltransferase family 4 protein [Lachnospiraceae bacterium]|nr:glycosyltransferase family 4 protein [Lachnospiraceae bacterium]